MWHNSNQKSVKKSTLLFTRKSGEHKSPTLNKSIKINLSDTKLKETLLFNVKDKI